jgi:anti-repressor protein
VPWWVLADVCAVLAIGNPSMAANSLDEEERGISCIETPSGWQEDGRETKPAEAGKQPI